MNGKFSKYNAAEVVAKDESPLVQSWGEGHIVAEKEQLPASSENLETFGQVFIVTVGFYKGHTVLQVLWKAPKVVSAGHYSVSVLLYAHHSLEPLSSCHQQFAVTAANVYECGEVLRRQCENILKAAL